ncbi:MAG: alpha/beta fold hydrolase [Candidatus Thorarchaeota archaeon]
MPVFQLNDDKLYYEMEGEGAPLLLIHGVRGTIRNWNYVRPYLTTRFLTIIPELRGHGQSTELKEPCTIDLFSNDLVSLLDYLDIDECIVAGHSLGGFIAQTMALNASNRVKALILIATAPLVDVEAAMAQIELGKLAFGLKPQDAIEIVLDNEFYDPDKIRNTPGLVEILLFNLKEGQRLANSHGCAQGAAAKFNVQDHIKKITAPTLAIFGSHDKTFPPRWAQFYEENLRNVTTKIIEKTNHGIFFEQPEALSKAIIDFSNTL